MNSQKTKNLKIEISDINTPDINFNFLATPYIEQKAIYDINNFINKLKDKEDTIVNCNDTKSEVKLTI